MNALVQRLVAPFDNPVLRRELKLITRRGRFEWVVLVLTVAMTLVIASVGGRTGTGIHPAQIGKVLFQTFFGIAQGLVLLAGPAVAASSIASEREGRTYEALALTGLSPGRIALGKFFAAFTNVGAYVLALAPVGALPFLFGGVSSEAMLLAFGMLAVVTAIATLTGLAISARLPTTRAALVTSVLAGAAMALAVHFVFGEAIGTLVSTSVGAQRPGTVWLPVLLAEANLTWVQAFVMVATPLVLATLVGWFLLEVCAANLADSSADRSTGLKRWFVVSALVGSTIASGPVLAASTGTARVVAAISAIAGYVLFALFGAFVFQGDALVAPRRVRLLWQVQRAGIVRRFMGPSVTAGAALQLGAAALAIGLISVVGLTAALGDEMGPAAAPLGIVAMALPAGTFVLFVVGLATWTRVRWGTGVARTVLAITLVVLFVAPYAVTAILGGGAADASGDSIVPLLASPSPAFAVEVANKVALDQADAGELMAVLLVCASYAVLGTIALLAGAVRADRLIASLDADAARMDTLIANEDATGVRRASRAPAAPPFPQHPQAHPVPSAPTAAHPAAVALPATPAGVTPPPFALPLLPPDAETPAATPAPPAAASAPAPLSRTLGGIATAKTAPQTAAPPASAPRPFAARTEPGPFSIPPEVPPELAAALRKVSEAAARPRPRDDDDDVLLEEPAPRREPASTTTTLAGGTAPPRATAPPARASQPPAPAATRTPALGTSMPSRPPVPAPAAEPPPPARDDASGSGEKKG